MDKTVRGERLRIYPLARYDFPQDMSSAERKRFTSEMDAALERSFRIATEGGNDE